MSERRIAFEVVDRGYTVRAFYQDNHVARIEITKGPETIRQLDYPAYKIWNVAAHFSEIVDDLIAEGCRR